MNIIQAIKDDNLFRNFLDPRDKGLGSWSSWLAALRVIYGLPLPGSQKELVRECTGRDPTRLPKGGFRKSLFLVGRRGGKSQAAALIGSYEAALGGHEGKIAPTEEGVVGIYSPTMRQSKKVAKHIEGIFSPKVSPMLAKLVVERSKTDGLLLKNNIRIQIIAGDPSKVRGDTLVAAIVDEAAFFGFDAEAKVRSDTELIRALRPALLTTLGKLIGISSPYAKRGYCYTQFKACWGNDAAGDLVWNCPTLTMNPTIPQAEIDAEIAEDPVANRCEYGGLFRDDVGEFIPLHVVEALVNAEGLEERPPQSNTLGMTRRYKGFVDVSGGRGDDAALAIAHNDGRRVVIDFMQRWKPPFNPYDVIGEMVVELRRYGLREVTGDNYAAEFVASAFRGRGIHYIQCEKNKNQLYLELLPILTSGEIELLDGELGTFAVNQIAGLERIVRSGGKDKIDHPPDGHDDVANAIAGVATMLARPPVIATADPGYAAAHGSGLMDRLLLGQLVRQQYGGGS